MSKSGDISAIRNLEKAWCDAWNTHDMKGLADLLLPAADFVTVGGTLLRGRKEFRDITPSTTPRHSNTANSQ
jgi:uncharacterized protein (TIGR02246 family)